MTRATGDRGSGRDRGQLRVIGVLFVLVFTLMVYQLIGAAVTEPLGEEVKGYDSIETVNGSSIIDETYKSQFLAVPIIMFFGFLVWGVRRVLRRERFTGRRRP